LILNFYWSIAEVFIYLTKHIVDVYSSNTYLGISIEWGDLAVKMSDQKMAMRMRHPLGGVQQSRSGLQRWSPRFRRLAVITAAVGMGVSGVAISTTPIAHAATAPTFTLDIVSGTCANTLFWQPRLVSNPGTSWRGVFTLTLTGDGGIHGITQTLTKDEWGYDSFAPGQNPFTGVDWGTIGPNPRLAVTWTYGIDGEVANGNLGAPFNIAVTPWSGPTLTTGTGTAANPFIVTTAAQVNEMRCHVESPTHFRLASDIDLAGIDFLPLGSGSGNGRMKGFIDGAGHTISNMRIDLPQSQNNGFVSTAQDLVMRDLTLTRADVFSYMSETGVVIGDAANNVRFTDVTITDSTVSARQTAGLFAGEMEHTQVIRPTAEGRVILTPWPYVGAQARIATDTVQNKSNVNAVGGFLGEGDENVQILNATTDLIITGVADKLTRFGGMIGYPDNDILIAGLDADITIDLVVRETGSFSDSVAGLLGDYGLDDRNYVVDSTVRLDMSLTAPETSDPVTFQMIGGIAGYAEEGGVMRSSITGSLTLDTRPATGSVTVERIGGALAEAPSNYRTAITETLVAVDITIFGDATKVGALAGTSSSGRFTDVRVDGSVSIKGNGTQIGGLIGWVEPRPDSWQAKTVINSVIHRGEVEVTGSANAVGTLFGDDADFDGLVGNTWWDSSINGTSLADRGLPGAPATSAQLGDSAWLTSAGFSTKVWCVASGVPTLVSPPNSPCQPRTTTGGGSIGVGEVVAERIRVEGTDRFATAASLSQRFFSPGVTVVYLATGAQFADALASGPLAGGSAPVLLVQRDKIPASTMDELLRLRPGSIVVLGGPAVVSDEVFASLDKLTSGSVTRLFGVDRYSTATAISKIAHPGTSSVVYVATGADFADALGGSPYATLGGGPILLVRPDNIPVSTATELRRLKPQRIVVLGGPNAVSADVMRGLGAYASESVSRIHGPDRYGTSVAISQAGFAPGVDIVFLATGRDFADGLSAAAISGGKGPVLLVRENCIPLAVHNEILRLRAKEIIVLGGNSAIGADVTAMQKCPS
jgi:putative cell wall-binding protein